MMPWIIEHDCGTHVYSDIDMAEMEGVTCYNSKTEVIIRSSIAVFKRSSYKGTFASGAPPAQSPHIRVVASSTGHALAFWTCP